MKHPKVESCGGGCLHVVRKEQRSRGAQSRRTEKNSEKIEGRKCASLLHNAQQQSALHSHKLGQAAVVPQRHPKRSRSKMADAVEAKTAIPL